MRKINKVKQFYDFTRMLFRNMVARKSDSFSNDVERSRFKQIKLNGTPIDESGFRNPNCQFDVG